MRRGKTDRVPRTRAGGQWTEAAFWAFIRSLLRQGSLKWPPRRMARIKARRPSQSDNKRMKWEYQCADCKEWFQEKQTEMDHINACGSLKCEEDLLRFFSRVFCEPDEWVCLCKECHRRKTHG